MSKCGWSEFNDPLKTIGSNTQNSVTPKGKRQVRLERTRSGKKGKLVTVIKGLELEQVEDKKDMLELKEIIQKHFEYTNSTVAQKILLDWNIAVSQFTKVMPIDYKRILQKEKRSSSLLDSRSKTKSATG